MVGKRWRSSVARSVAVESSHDCSTESRIGRSDMGFIRHHERVVSSVLDLARDGWAVERFWHWRQLLLLQIVHIFLLIQEFSGSLADHRANSDHHFVRVIWSEGVILNGLNEFVSLRALQNSRVA